MIKWLKEGYSNSIKKVLNAHKIGFKKGLWFGIFMAPILYAEIYLIAFVFAIIVEVLFGSGEPPTPPMIIDN
jgi:hypothetical protein|tara:strand:+ start:274 stop:489 length:216 start_codon:yes stop_codon:yes gene_type:complete